MADQSVCSRDGCGKKKHSRGLCPTHYHLLWKYGSEYAVPPSNKAARMKRVLAARAGRIWREERLTKAAMMAARSPCMSCRGHVTRKKRSPDDGLKFCSRACGDQFKRDAAALKRISVSVKRSRCVHCQEQAHGRKYCGDKCSRAAHRIVYMNSQTYEDTKAKMRESYASGVVACEAKCMECGTGFIVSGKRRVFCSQRCGKRASNRISDKARDSRIQSAKVENVDPSKVFMRDGWKCKHCGAKTPQSLRGKNRPRSPELDHIMPLSLGGEHSYRNTQCLCRKCNGLKGNTPMGQLVLL